MNGTILNIVMTILCISLVIFVVHKNKISFKHDIGLVFPDWKNLVFWVSLFMLLIVFEDYLYQEYSSNIPVSWKDKYTTSQMLLRGFGIVLLAPISEELIFRGLLFWRIENTKLKIFGAIVIPAILFSIIHLQYSEIVTLGIIFIDGIFYGLARHVSKSVILAIILHALSNFGALLERL